MKLFYVTFPDREALEDVRSAVLEEKLAACVNSFDIESAFLWNGDIDRGEEIVALFKTSEGKAEDLKKFIEEEHPYDVPCILDLPVEANKKYEEWVGENC